MPKKSKDDDSSSSDSGPDDVNPPPSKKSKGDSSVTKGKASGGRGGGGSGDDEYKWLLEKKKFVNVRPFKGQIYVDIRDYYESDGELKPTKKGISLSTTAWRKLMSLSEEIDEAVKQLC